MPIITSKSKKKISVKYSQYNFLLMEGTSIHEDGLYYPFYNFSMLLLVFYSLLAGLLLTPTKGNFNLNIWKCLLYFEITSFTSHV